MHDVFLLTGPGMKTGYYDLVVIVTTNPMTIPPWVPPFMKQAMMIGISSFSAIPRWCVRLSHFTWNHDVPCHAPQLEVIPGTVCDFMTVSTMSRII